MDELAMLDREAFAQVWSRVDAQGTGVIEPVPGPGPAQTPPEGTALQELVETCLEGAEAYRALARRARRSGGELAALRDQKTAQARRLSAAYLLRSGVRYWPQTAQEPGPGQSFFATLRERYLAEGRLRTRLEDLARTDDQELGQMYTQLAQETADMARRVHTVVEREL